MTADFRRSPLPVQFVTQHGRVIRYRAGTFSEVARVEGCNQATGAAL